MVEYGKAVRPSLVDLMKETSALSEKVDDIESLPVVSIDYSTEDVTERFTAIVDKKYSELAKYTSCIVNDAHIDDVTLGSIKIVDGAMQIAYGFSGMVDGNITFNHMTLYIDTDNSAEISIETYSFSGSEDNIFVITLETAYSPDYPYHTVSTNATFNDIDTAFSEGKIVICRYDSRKSPGGPPVYTYTDTLSPVGRSIFDPDSFYITEQTLQPESNLIRVNTYTYKINRTNGITIDNYTSQEVRNYTLPTASDTQLGGVKVGSGLSIDNDGVLSAESGDGNTIDYYFYSYDNEDDTNISFSELESHFTNDIKTSKDVRVYIDVDSGSDNIRGFVHLTRYKSEQYDAFYMGILGGKFDLNTQKISPYALIAREDMNVVYIEKIS